MTTVTLLMHIINLLQSGVQSHLLEIQSKFRTTLVTNVTEFKLSVDDFTGNYAQVSLFLLVTVVIVTLVEWSNGAGYSPS